MGRTCSTYGERRSEYRVFVGDSWGKGIKGTKRRREDSIKMDLLEVGCRDMGWTELAQDRDRWWAFVNGVMSLRVL